VFTARGRGLFVGPNPQEESRHVQYGSCRHAQVQVCRGGRAGPEHSDISVANEVAGSLTGSQRPQIHGHAKHMQPRRVRPSGTSGCIRHRPATLRKRLLSSRSRVRVTVGAQIILVVHNIRNYDRSIDALLAGNRSIRCITFRMSRRVRAHQAELRSRCAPRRWSPTGEPTASTEAEHPFRTCSAEASQRHLGGRGVITAVCMLSLPWLPELDPVRG
jgi:hypothetical protein